MSRIILYEMHNLRQVCAHVQWRKPLKKEPWGKIVFAKMLYCEIHFLTILICFMIINLNLCFILIWWKLVCHAWWNLKVGEPNCVKLFIGVGGDFLFKLYNASRRSLMQKLSNLIGEFKQFHLKILVSQNK